MQPNGGFFASGMPQNATSFMPSQGSPAGFVSGIQGTPEAYQSSPMGPQLMAALMALGKMGGGQQDSGGPSALPANSFSPFDANGGQPQGQQPQQGGQPAAGGQPDISSLLKQLNPEQLKGILSRLGIGGTPGAS